jgi:hypothetical protein
MYSMGHKNGVFHIPAMGNWMEWEKPCCACVYVLECSLVSTGSLMVNCNITAVETYPENKPNVHERICFWHKFLVQKMAELLSVVSFQSGLIILM